MITIYHILDIFFVIFHSLLTLFNLLGWIWKKTRLANLITLLLTGASWFLLGIFYGWGYCPLTDWHFKVLQHLGKINLPGSYIKYLVDRIFHTSLPSQMVDRWTLILFLAALVISLFMNFRNRLKK
ncbi:MAG: DUF2784 domain-containing protein [Chlorobi bacterium]|nr:DUF2784 domain-containing protein [Chlorobiota bacterium]